MAGPVNSKHRILELAGIGGHSGKTYSTIVNTEGVSVSMCVPKKSDTPHSRHGVYFANSLHKHMEMLMQSQSDFQYIVMPYHARSVSSLLHGHTHAHAQSILRPQSPRQRRACRSEHTQLFLPKQRSGLAGDNSSAVALSLAQLALHIACHMPLLRDGTGN